MAVLNRDAPEFAQLAAASTDMAIA
jgi:hypothetical protein